MNYIAIHILNPFSKLVNIYLLKISSHLKKYPTWPFSEICILLNNFRKTSILQHYIRLICLIWPFLILKLNILKNTLTLQYFRTLTWPKDQGRFDREIAQFKKYPPKFFTAEKRVVTMMWTYENKYYRFLSM